MSKKLVSRKLRCGDRLIIEIDREEGFPDCFSAVLENASGQEMVVREIAHRSDFKVIGEAFLRAYERSTK